jgi:methylmalonyl-CoA mutase
MEEAKLSGFLSHFPAVSTEEWETKILEDLKGADYERTLVWKTADGIKARPYYRSEHLEHLAHMGTLPAEPPFVRGKTTKSNDWLIRQDIDEPDIVKANALAIRAVERGADAIGFHVGDIAGLEDMKRMLQGIDMGRVAIHLNHGKEYPALFGYLIALAGTQSVTGSLNFDPLAYFLLYGKPYGKLNDNMEQAAGLLNAASEFMFGYKVITVNGQHYHNAGAGIIQELAFVLLQGNEYLAQLTDRGFTADDITPFMQFNMAVGSDYFLEIAKLRAVKMLWSTIVAQYHPTKKESLQMNLHAESSRWNKSIYDPYVNLLRTTTEGMSAALAGADSILIHPFDNTFKKADEYSLRLARNQQAILKHEAYFNKVIDPAGGSYYIENLTGSIARAAWDLFVEADGKGGFIPAVENGHIYKEIDKTCQRRDIDIAMRKQVFVGSNQYPDNKERVLYKLQPTANLADIGGLRFYRGVQAFEALRLAVENHEAKGLGVPKVFLFTYGNLAMRKARAGFSTNFFGIAGYEIAEGAGYIDPFEGVRDAVASKASVVVFCSSDEEYAELAPAISELKKQAPDTLIVVAGNPKEHTEQLNRAGTDQYIHLRTNALDTLAWFNDKLGIM